MRTAARSGATDGRTSFDLKAEELLLVDAVEV
jgi:hypothetical protein